MSRLPTLILLAMALFTGIVPLQRCDALGGGGSGVVPLGEHGHSHHVNDGHVGHDSAACSHRRVGQGSPSQARAHEAGSHDGCSCDVVPTAPPGHDACCVDTPFDARLSAEVVTLAPPVLLPPTAWAGAGDAAVPPPVPAWARPDAPPDTLRSIRNTVLLR